MKQASIGSLTFTVTDLKQLSYCPRIPFYRYVLPVDTVKTYKMQRGRSSQAVVESLERRRKFREYALREGERRFDVAVRSDRLGLSGRIDLLLLSGSSCYPVDFKDTEGGVRANHRVQLAAYGLLAEEQFQVPAPGGFIYLVPTDEVVRVEFTIELRDRVERSVDRLRAMVAEERLPEPTSVRARCTACEFQNYCADIW